MSQFFKFLNESELFSTWKQQNGPNFQTKFSTQMQQNLLKLLYRNEIFSTQLDQTDLLLKFLYRRELFFT